METTPSTRPLAITRAGIVGTLLVVAVVAMCVRLGFWQLSRLEQRREFNAGIAARLDQHPIGDVAQLADTSGAAYRVASARGTFDNDRYIVLPGRARQGVPGVHLIMPLRLANHPGAVLVNRGWVPSPDAASIDVAPFRMYGTVDVNGLVLPFPGAAQSLAQRGVQTRDSVFRHIWFVIDEPALRAQLPYPLLDIMLQELPEPGEPAQHGTPARLGPPALDEGPHLGYAIQWFAFAIIGVGGWFAMVFRGRNRPHENVRVAALALVLAVVPGDAAAQLRPLDPLEWRVFDESTWLVAGAGAGVLVDQPATLAGTRGRLIEIGMYTVAIRSSRVAIELGGTALWRFTEQDTIAPPVGGVDPSTGIRLDPGGAFASTAFRFSRDQWPVDLVLRFGATIPTTSDESGLDRDRTDFFALMSARYQHGALTVTAENGVGINGTLRQDLPQSDVWTYAFGAAWTFARVRLAADLAGRHDGLDFVLRGNENQGELRAGFDIGHDRWLRIRYIRGLSSVASPAHGVRIMAGGLRQSAR